MPETYSKNLWRKIAGKGEDYPLQIRSNTWLMDLRLETGEAITLPEAPAKNCSFLFYVFDGRIKINETIALASGESAWIEMESPTFLATQTTDIVLFITQTTAGYFDGGMYSGNLHS